MGAVLVAGLPLGHALIHASYLAPAPATRPGAPAWPFHLERSWLLTPFGIGQGTSRMIGSVLVAATIGGFALAAVAALGIVPAGLWQVGIVLGAVASVATLGLYFHRWLVVGLAIDILLLWSVVAGGWVPDGLGR